MKIALFSFLSVSSVLLAAALQAEESTKPLAPVPSYWDASHWEKGSPESFWKKTDPSPADREPTRRKAAPQPTSPSGKNSSAHHSPRFLDRQTEK